jgi:hypothetical protein
MFVLNLQFQVVFGKLEKYQTGWAHLSATVFEPPRADRMPDVQIAAAATTLLSPPVLSTALPSPPVLATTLPSPPVLTAYKARGGQDELPLFTSSTSMSPCSRSHSSGKLTVDNRSPSSLGPSKSTTSSPFILYCSPTRSPTLTTFRPHCRRPPLHRRLSHRR